MNNLLIDIGNSGIKTALSKGRSVYSVKRFSYSDENFLNDFKKSLTYKKKEVGRIGVSCLNKNNHKLVDYICKLRYSIKPEIIKFSKSLPIKIIYEKSLGTDRICSAVAAAVKYRPRKNILVIDFGTATTYNLIINLVYLGGLITPGIITSLSALNSHANLPVAGLKSSGRLVRNKTEANIISGVMHQSLFTTEKVIEKLKKDYKDLFIVCTGGLADIIFKKTKLIDKKDKNLVLEGINYIINQKQTKY
ncbi:MAG: type III pantothenate kinase [Ignavibacteriae bacterium]|nr:type III pantothenate kinase [Ignavibacteriota bacterium]